MHRLSCRLFVGLAAAVTLAVTAGAGPTAADTQTHTPAESPVKQPDFDMPTAAELADPAYVLRYEMPRIDGSKQHLAAYEGKVILIVNTASKCGLTPQYEGLEKLYGEHKDEGLVILGFPANNFAGQEPGTNFQIAQFCSERFDVSFPMFAKLSVKGDDVSPLYKQLAEQPEPIGTEPAWNFHKFLVDRSGRVVAQFSPQTTPDDEKLVEAIEHLLAGEPIERSKAEG